MLLRIASDLHTEFYSYNKFSKLLRHYLPPDDRDSESILILAGDIGTFAHYSSTIKPLLDEVSKRFKQVLYVYGNHEFYIGAWWHDYEKFWLERLLPKNVKILNADFFIIDDVVFSGATLWTGMDNRNPITMWHCERNMNDYNLIKYDAIPSTPYGCRTGIRISAENTVLRYEHELGFIKQSLQVHRPLFSKHVVITHHLPSFLSVNKKYQGELLNHAFASELSDMVLHYQPSLWVHGHTHTAVDYKLGDTRIMCNPVGYHGSVEIGRTGYIDRLFVEI
jgi:Icc-related predicted phosphoesterase